MPSVVFLSAREPEHAVPRERTGCEPQTNYTMVPNAFFSIWIQVLSGNEFKIASWVVRNTIGWINDDPHGGRRRQTKPTPYGVVARETGISRPKAMQAARLLEAVGLISILGSQGKMPSFTINVSRLAQPGSLDQLVKKIDKLRKGNLSQNDTSTCQESLQVLVKKTHKLRGVLKEENKTSQNKKETSASSYANISGQLAGDDETATENAESKVAIHIVLGEGTEPNGHVLDCQALSDNQETSSIYQASIKISMHELSTADEACLSRIENFLGQMLNGKAKQRILMGLQQAGYSVSHLELLLPTVFRSRRRIENPIGLLISVAESFGKYAEGLSWPEYLGGYAAGVLQQGSFPSDETRTFDGNSGQQTVIATISGFPAMHPEADHTCSQDFDTELPEALALSSFEQGPNSCPESTQGVISVTQQKAELGQAQWEQKRTEEQRAIEQRELKEADICPVCRGDHAQQPCFACSDTGQFYSVRRLLEENLCNDCKGSGRWQGRNCFSCKGSGRPTWGMVKQYKVKMASDTREDRSC